MKSPDFSRSDRLSDLIRTEVSIILRDEVRDPRLNGLTIIRVELSKDTKKAFVFFSPLNSFSKIDPEEIIEALRKAKGFIRTNLGKKIKIKYLPELSFHQDMEP